MKSVVTEINKEVIQIVTTPIIRIDLDQAEVVALIDFIGMSLDSGVVFWNTDRRVAAEFRTALMSQVDKL